MQKGKVINLNGYRKMFEFVFKNKEILLFVLIFFVSFLFGVLSFRGDNPNSNLTETYIIDFVTFRLKHSFFKILFHSFLNGFFWVVLIYIFGSGILGILISPIALAFFSYFGGNISAYLYSEFGLKGIAFHSIIILPTIVLTVIALILCSVEALNFSLKLIKLTMPKVYPYSLFNDFKLYCLRFLFFSLLILFSAVIDGLISINFLDSFNLF